jgi:NRAMP (natural resistance-associated macrophage protein)-like metal ion transporter
VSQADVALPPVGVLEQPSGLERLRARGRMRYGFGLLGPAFVAAVAYVDPGNFATNIAGGSKYGYLLLWVILGANLMAMLIQYLSAKVGIATGKNLPELCREHFPRTATIGLWIQAELIAMATDLAEFVGAAIALNLLFGVPLFASGLITAVVAFAILGLQTRGYRRFETTIVGLLGVILLGFVYEVVHSGADASGVASGFVPGFAGTESVLLATGILGATVMPHVIYLHSALTQSRLSPKNDAERREILRFQRVDVGIAMGVAGLVNMSMLIVAAALFHGVIDVDSIETAHKGFESQLGTGAAVAFQRRHLRRPGGHAGLHPTLDPADGAAPDHDDARADRPGRRPRPDRLARRQPGGALVRHPVRPGAARAADPAQGRDGVVPQRSGHDARGQRRRRDDHRAEPLPAGQDFRGLRFGAMALAEDFQAVVDSLPPDWTQVELDMRIADEDRYVEAATLLTQINAMPYSEHDWHWRLRCAHEFGHAAAPETVHGTLALLDDQGIAGELVLREARAGRVEVTQMWGRPESVRQEFRERRAQ